jgi:hypothetical protein
MALYKVSSGDLPLASDVNQLVDIFSGKHDIGTVTFAPVISTPSTAGITVSVVAGTALGVGAYRYKLTYITGYKKTNGTTVITGETAGSATISITTTSGNQAIQLSGLPVGASWPASAIGLRIYRTAVGGADGTQKLVTTITTLSTSTYTDTVTDATLGAAIPVSNTTGTSIGAVTHSGAATFSSTLAVTGATTLSSTLAVTGATTLSSTLAVTGAATFSSDLTVNSDIWTGKASTQFLQFTADNANNYIESWNGAKTGSAPLKLGGRFNAATPIYTPNNTLDDGSGGAVFKSMTMNGSLVMNVPAGSTQWSWPIYFKGTDASGVTRQFYLQANTAGDVYFANNSGQKLLSIENATKSVNTANNNLDDGNGLATFSYVSTTQNANGFKFQSNGGANGFMLVPNAGNSNYSPMTAAGDALITTANNGGNLTIAAWSNTAAGMRISSDGNIVFNKWSGGDALVIDPDGDIIMRGQTMIPTRNNSGVAEWWNGSAWTPLGGIKSVQRGVSGSAGATISHVDPNKAFVVTPVGGNFGSSAGGNASYVTLAADGNSIGVNTLLNNTYSMAWEVIEYY